MANLCSQADCKRQHAAHGLCNMHYLRTKRGKPLEAPGRVVVRGSDKPETCTFGDCKEPYRAGGYCAGHYTRAYHGRRMDAHRAPHLSGVSTRMTKAGYRQVWLPAHPGSTAGWYYEHRYVMEQVINRALEQSESVHHINGVKDDNRAENLELWVSWQPSGQRVADLVAWAHEVLNRYESA